MRRIVTDPHVCHGKPCFEGTRILVSVILDSIAEGLSAKQIAEEYPPLAQEDILAAIHFASTLLNYEEYPLQKALP